MGSLTGNRIDLTYEGLIKTNDEQPIDGTLKSLQDGVGNNLAASVSTEGMQWNGAQDFTGSTNIALGIYDLTSTVDAGVTNINLSDGANTDTVSITPGSGFDNVNGSLNIRNGYQSFNTSWAEFDGYANNVILASVMIPANTYRVGDMLQIDGGFQAIKEYHSDPQLVRHEIWISRSLDTPYDNLISLYEPTGTYNFIRVYRTLYVTPFGTKFGVGANYPTIGITDDVATPNDLAPWLNNSSIPGYFQSPFNKTATQAINWAVDQYLIFKITQLNGDDIVRLHGLQIRKNNP